MGVSKGNIISTVEILPSKVSSPGVWSLTDIRSAQLSDTWPYPTLNDYAAAIPLLFASNEPGVWYDPSDLTTMFQDITGQTAVSTVEQPVALWFDKSRGSFYGTERITNGDFSNGSTGWTLQSGVIVSGGKLTCTSAANIAYQSDTLVIGKVYRVTFDMEKTTGANVRLSGVTKIGGGTMLWATTTGTLTAVVIATSTTFGLEADFGLFTGTIDNVSIKEVLGTTMAQPSGSARPTVSRRHNLLVGTTALATQTVTTTATNFTLSFSGAGSVTLSGTATGTYSAGTNTFNATAGTLTITVSGAVNNAQLVPTYKAGLPYQSVTNSTTYDTDPTKFPAYMAAKNASNSMYTATTIDPGTNKVQIFTGISTQTAGESAMILSFNINADAANGSFSLLGPRTGEALRFKTTGTTSATINTSGINEINGGRFVYTAIGEIANNIATIRRNGTAWSSSESQGIGNYLSNYLYLFTGSGTIFTGECYGVIVRFGPTLTGIQLASVETYMKDKTGISF